MNKKYAVIVISILSILLIGTVCLAITQKIKTEKEIPNNYDNELTSPYIPDKMTFAGETVPLDVYWVHEALDRELIINCYQHSKTLRIFKLSTRYFPTIERILKEEGVPEDFKYLCVAESGLENVESPASAGGYWQFMPSTGKIYGLDITNEIDERCDLEKSTRAACKYLKNSKERFGSWTMAAAAYNRGEGGLQNAITDQNCTNYWDLWLNSETSRYVYRIIAFKLMFDNPRIYGIKLCPAQMYQPIPTTDFAVTASIPDMVQFAQDQHITYRELRMLNPWLRGSKLTVSGKTFNLKLPVTPKASYNSLFSHCTNPFLIIGDSTFHND